MKDSPEFVCDALLKQATDIAREALSPIAHPEEIGSYQGAQAEGKRLVTHSFECLKPGYVGWRWIATLARIPRGRKPTVCEIDLLPGEGALLAPDWVPWEQRLSQEEVKTHREFSRTRRERRDDTYTRRKARSRRRRRQRKVVTNGSYILVMNKAICEAYHVENTSCM